MRRCSHRRPVCSVAGFGNGIADELKKKVADLSKAGAKSLDHRRSRHRRRAARKRDRGGTALRQVGHAVDSCRTGRSEQGDVRSRSRATARSTLPVQVLVTTGTSGAAELFAAALRDNKRGDLIGERTLGRAGLQRLVKLPEGRGLWLTYAQLPIRDDRRRSGAAAKAADSLDPRHRDRRPAECAQDSWRRGDQRQGAAAGRQCRGAGRG